MEAPFNYITESLNITKAVAKECSRSGDNEQSVNYYIEQPKYKNTIQAVAVIERDMKIYVIDDGEHTTMLFAEEY